MTCLWIRYPSNQKSPSTKVSKKVKAMKLDTVEHIANRFSISKQGEVGPCSKYDLPLRIKSKPITYKYYLTALFFSFGKPKTSLNSALSLWEVNLCPRMLVL